MKEFVFVYGTLKRNCKNNHVLLSTDSKFVCEVVTVEKFPMFDLGDGFPYIQNSPDKGNIITGEIWSVPSDNMNTLDYFEGVDSGLYKPVYIDCHDKDDELYTSVRCYMKAQELSDDELSNLEMLSKWIDDKFDRDKFMKQLFGRFK
jgi:gamma-glutamylcyclotransferase (GGCT)/AIG2-like uncharacterized protein YtfP